MTHYIVKKTLQIIIEKENDYLVKVKGNQPNLLNATKDIVAATKPVSRFVQKENKRGRKEKRIIKVFLPTDIIPEDWPELNRIIHIERLFKSKRGIHHTHSYYISSLISNNAKLFAQGIRGHWYIENKLHWVKDAILKEDSTKHKMGSAAKNMSIIRNIAINILRGNGYTSTKHATLFFASNVKELINILFRT